MRKINTSNFTARNEKLSVLGTSKVPVCPEYLYGKMTVYAPTLIKKTRTAVNGFTFMVDDLFITSFPYPLT